MENVKPHGFSSPHTDTHTHSAALCERLNVFLSWQEFFMSMPFVFRFVFVHLRCWLETLSSLVALSNELWLTHHRFGLSLQPLLKYWRLFWGVVTALHVQTTWSRSCFYSAQRRIEGRPQTINMVPLIPKPLWTLKQCPPPYQFDSYTVRAYLALQERIWEMV